MATMSEAKCREPQRITCAEGQCNEAHKVLRIVHISDTHMRHMTFLENELIPDGDVLIHSGDFGQYRFKRRFGGEQDMIKEVEEINYFFSELPHKYKIFVAGNHETTFPAYSATKINKLLTNGIYLEDSFVTIDGVKIYGTPWNLYRWYSNASAFGASDKEMKKACNAIPMDTDILVTHNPPLGVLDLACMSTWKNLWRAEQECHVCSLQDGHQDETRPGFVRKHWGCKRLRDVLRRVRPKAHLFGHVHGKCGVQLVDSVVCSNAALACLPKPVILDICLNNTETNKTFTDPVYCISKTDTSCTIS